MNTLRAVDKFYLGEGNPENNGLQFTEFIAESSPENSQTVVRTAKTELLKPVELPSFAQVQEKLKEIAQTLQVIEYNGRTFEIAIANQDASDVMLHVSTYSSSISGNPGNAWEFAVNALLYPNHKHIYVASPGNGASSPITGADKEHIAKTGRFAKEENGIYVPIQYVQDMGDALDAHGIQTTQLMGTDSAGGPIGRALAMTLEQNQLEKAFFNEVTGLQKLGLTGLLKAMATEMRVNMPENKKISPDPHKLTGEMVQAARSILEEYANPMLREARVAKKVGVTAMAGAWLTSARALSKGEGDDGITPFVFDTQALMQKHPHAKITYAFAENSPLHPHEIREQLTNLIRKQLLELNITDGTVIALIVDGMTHAYKESFPQEYYALQQHALK